MRIKTLFFMLTLGLNTIFQGTDAASAATLALAIPAPVSLTERLSHSGVLIQSVQGESDPAFASVLAQYSPDTPTGTVSTSAAPVHPLLNTLRVSSEPRRAAQNPYHLYSLSFVSEGASPSSRVFGLVNLGLCPATAAESNPHAGAIIEAYQALGMQGKWEEEEEKSKEGESAAPTKVRRYRPEPLNFAHGEFYFPQTGSMSSSVEEQIQGYFAASLLVSRFILAQRPLPRGNSVPLHFSVHWQVSNPLVREVLERLPETSCQLVRPNGVLYYDWLYPPSEGHADRAQYAKVMLVQKMDGRTAEAAQRLREEQAQLEALLESMAI